MAGIERARRHGLDVACICTFTPRSAPHVDEVFDFFAAEGLDFSVHAAIPPLSPGPAGASAGTWSLHPELHAGVLLRLLDRYLSAPANLEDVVARRDEDRGLLRRGPIARLLDGGPRTRSSVSRDQRQRRCRGEGAGAGRITSCPSTPIPGG